MEKESGRERQISCTSTQSVGEERHQLEMFKWGSVVRTTCCFGKHGRQESLLALLSCERVKALLGDAMCAPVGEQTIQNIPSSKSAIRTLDTMSYQGESP